MAPYPPGRKLQELSRSVHPVIYLWLRTAGHSQVTPRCRPANLAVKPALNAASGSLSNQGHFRICMLARTFPQMRDGVFDLFTQLTLRSASATTHYRLVRTVH